MHTLTDEQHRHLLALVRRMAITTGDVEWCTALDALEVDAPSNVVPLNHRCLVPLAAGGGDVAVCQLGAGHVGPHFSRKADRMARDAMASADWPEDAPDVDPGTRGLVKALRAGWELGRRNAMARGKEGA